MTAMNPSNPIEVRLIIKDQIELFRAKATLLSLVMLEVLFN